MASGGNKLKSLSVAFQHALSVLPLYSQDDELGF